MKKDNMERFDLGSFFERLFICLLHAYDCAVIFKDFAQCARNKILRSFAAINNTAVLGYNPAPNIRDFCSIQM